MKKEKTENLFLEIIAEKSKTTIVCRWHDAIYTENPKDATIKQL